MAFGRILEVFVGRTLTGLPVEITEGFPGDGNFLRIVGAGQNGVSLDCDAEVRRSNRMSKNTANLKVYNLPKSVREFLREDGLLVRIDVGYEDSGKGTLFYGAIGGAQSYMTEAVWVTEISAYHFRAKGMSFETLYVSLSYSPGTLLKTVFADIEAILGVPVIGAGGLGQHALANGLVPVGTMGSVLKLLADELRSIGMGIFIDLAEIVLYKTGDVKDAEGRFETVYLDNQHGLLAARRKFAGVRESRQEVRSLRRLKRLNEAVAKSRSSDGKTRTDQTAAKPLATLRLDEVKRERVQFRCLANHRIRPSCLVQIDHNEVKGPFVVDDISAKLSTYANSFHFDVGASREP